MPIFYRAAKVGRFWMGALCADDQIQSLHLSLKTRGEVMETLRHRLLALKDAVADNGPAPCLEQLFQQVGEYLQGERVVFDVALDLTGATAFQRQVWRACQTIPYGQTRSYKWVADAMDRPDAIRAVGSALAANPVPILIPCHRVLRSDHSLGGFSCGLEVKKALLKVEQN